MTDTNTAEREALMDLIDDYAEARHVGGCHTYNAKTAEARAKVVTSLAASAGSEPVAWAVFAENGNIRIWSQKPLQHPAMPLYTRPSPPEGMAGWKLVPVEPTLDMGWAYLDAARGSEPLRTHSFNHAGYRAMIAAAPPLPASAKEL